MSVELVVTDDWVDAAAQLLANTAAAGGHVALSGGSSPRPVHERAAELCPDWSGVHVWWGDDRCVPPDDERSNYRLAKESLLDRLDVQPEVHRIRGELPPHEAAAAYEQELGEVVLDLAVQGIGPDGHTASLFPDKPAVAEGERRVVATQAGLEPFVDRVTMTVPTLCAARLVLFLVVGEDKAEAVEWAFAQEPTPAVPASLVRSATGQTVAILDPAAASRLQP